MCSDNGPQSLILGGRSSDNDALRRNAASHDCKQHLEKVYTLIIVGNDPSETQISHALPLLYASAIVQTADRTALSVRSSSDLSHTLPRRLLRLDSLDVGQSSTRL